MSEILCLQISMLEMTKSSITFATFTSRVGNKDFLVQEGFLHPKMYVAKLYPNFALKDFFLVLPPDYKLLYPLLFAISTYA